MSDYDEFLRILKRLERDGEAGGDIDHDAVSLFFRGASMEEFMEYFRGCLESYDRDRDEQAGQRFDIFRDRVRIFISEACAVQDARWVLAGWRNGDKDMAMKYLTEIPERCPHMDYIYYGITPPSSTPTSEGK